MRRAPALLCTDEVCQLESYECLMVEPLHDIKNVVNRIFDGLCLVIPDDDGDLKNEVIATIAAIKGGLLILYEVTSQQITMPIT